ncbi:ABC transporter permease subunit [Nocardioides sp. IC4_145]|uniref:ABC transporter permease n=1 Tax=Nocardioides sp. IC4_145 TaxID=2714037 RepID=UPI00140D45EC|nr:ABC transporter permease subunit [Nocardioides sp. IC4_145]NHC22911.1 ABC transporter permease subunit [Nocardioides sp. IC4_145]
MSVIDQAVLPLAAEDWERVDGVPRIPLGDWILDGFEWVQDHLGGVLDAVADLTETTVDGLTDLLDGPAPLVTAAVLALIAWLAKDWKLALGSFVGLAGIIGVEQWTNAMATLSLVLVATLVALVIGIPLGVLAARSDRFSRVVRPVMDLMQTMPAFVWLVPVVMLFSIGSPPALVATVIFALPPAVRLTELGIRQVDAEVVEAGHAFGATPRQILRETQLPLALPTVMAGVNQVIMLALSMAVIAGLVGGGGLGGAVTSSISRLDIGLGFEAGLSVVVLAVYLDRVTASAGRRTPGQRGRARALLARRRATADAAGRTPAPAVDGPGAPAAAEPEDARA